MDTLRFKVTGIEPLLFNNPRTVDPFDSYQIEIQKITKKTKKTPDDIEELRRLEIDSKMYFDPEIGVYIPHTWITASVAGASWKLKRISKGDVRSAVFPLDSRIKLFYRDMKKVKKLADISGNPAFCILKLLKQNKSKIPKAMPIFHDWSFETGIEYDPSVLDGKTLSDILHHAILYGGLGDLRPTYGRAHFERID